MDKKQWLEELFGAFAQKTTPERVRAYSRWANQQDESTVSEIIQFVIREDSRFPSVSRLYQLTRENYLRHHVDEDECWFCDGTGFVPGVWLNRLHGKWYSGVISRCKCSNGFRKMAVPLIDFENDPRYIRLLGGKDLAPWGAMAFWTPPVVGGEKS